jgi:acyl-CoA synthetase (AMP-forming)/AMP-acid ligase II
MVFPWTHANLLASAGKHHSYVCGLSEADRCSHLMPLFHIHGLVGALLSSVMAGAGVICPSGVDVRTVLPVD